MRKKKIIIALVCLFSVFGVGCGQKEDNNVKQGEENKVETKDEQKEISSEDSNVKVQKEIRVSYINPDSGETETEVKKVDDLTTEIIWDALKEKNVIQEDAGFNSCELNEEDKSISLDVDQQFGDDIRRMGTTEESEVLKCVVNTFLDSYNYDKIKITENDQVFETSDAVLNGYMTRQ
ncbi:hypothetical protein DWV75_04330 [Ruminococcus sp. AF12-5]|nr:hypothetical protein DWV75_04330 [Ruminococcus sp. AF12-5]